MKLLLISDFNTDNLAGYLRNSFEGDSVQVSSAPLGQVFQTLLGGNEECWDPGPDVCIIWTRPEAILGSFASILEGQQVETDRLLAEVDTFVALLETASKRAPIVLLPTWTIDPVHMFHGLADLATDRGVVRALWTSNLRLVEGLDKYSNVHPLAADRWLQLVGPESINSRLWYGAKIPFGNKLIKCAANSMVSAINGTKGRSRKLLLLDLDNTLWKGVLGDVGMDGLNLGGHDPVGEALVDFQKDVKALAKRGIALGILSKNDETTALAAISNHPEMVLRVEDFAGWRINWNDKAANLADLAAELRLGLDSIVFIDDNPVERGRVREALPEVLVPDWPADIRLYPNALRSLSCFDLPATTSVDRERSKMYQAERSRKRAQQEMVSISDWLKRLETIVEVIPAGLEFTRIVQLINKTNQMNLCTRRLSEMELREWLANPQHRMWGFRVKDRFGDSGLTGILSLRLQGTIAHVADFILSCRVMGRGVESSMISFAMEWASGHGLDQVVFEYIPTAKNQPCYDLMLNSGLERTAEHKFVWSLEESFPDVPYIQRLVSNEANLN